MFIKVKGEKIKVYPNPFYKTFYIDFQKSIPNGTPILIDESGKRIIPVSEKTITGWKVNCSNIISGVYTMLIENTKSIIPCGRVIAK